MNNLKIVYFYESGEIYPFLKEEKNSNEEYYTIKKLKNVLKDEEKENILLDIKTWRYINLLKKGYSYEEIKDSLNQATEKVFERRNTTGINEIYLDKEALNLAQNLYKSTTNKTKKLKRN